MSETNHVFSDGDGAVFSLTKIGAKPFLAGHFVQHFTIIFNFGGPLEIGRDCQILTLKKDELAFLQRGAAVSCANESGCESWVLQFNWQFYCLEYHDSEISCNGLLFNTAIEPPVVSLDVSAANEVRHWVEIVQNELSEKDDKSGEMLRLLLKRLLIRCARLARKQQPVQASPPASTEIVRQFSKLVEAHFREKHSVADYAAMLHRSPKTLSNVFRTLGQPSPLEIIHDRIALEARRMLRFSDKPVKEISLDLGFSDAAHFAHFFKKKTGSFPTNLRNEAAIAPAEAVI